MKHLLFLSAVIVLSHSLVSAQQSADKERAEQIAKDDFSKSKYLKKEKYGVVKELNKVVVSQPVIKDNNEYAGLYKAQDFGNTLELIVTEKAIEAVLKKGNDDSVSYLFYQLTNVVIRDALFKATLLNKNGSEELVEGVFINKNDNGATDFGLGIKLPKNITLNGLHIDKLLFKKM